MNAGCIELQEGLELCYFHPNEVVVGVCAFCLNERLMILASKKNRSSTSRHVSSTSQTNIHRNPPAIILSKIFTFTSLLTSSNRRRNSELPDRDDASTSSKEDSFISMKFEENGVGSWEKNRVRTSKVTQENYNMSLACKDQNLLINKERDKNQSKSVIEHGKSCVALRWRKHIGHLSQLIRWKRSNKVRNSNKSNWTKDSFKNSVLLINERKG